jgi:hypothetical protein
MKNPFDGTAQKTTLGMSLRDKASGRPRVSIRVKPDQPREQLRILIIRPSRANLDSGEPWRSAFVDSAWRLSSGLLDARPATCGHRATGQARMKVPNELSSLQALLQS